LSTTKTTFLVTNTKSENGLNFEYRNQDKYRRKNRSTIIFAVGLILLGRQLEQKTAQKVCVTMSFLLFTLKNKKC
jgi:hypothetical protein